MITLFRTRQAKSHGSLSVVFRRLCGRVTAISEVPNQLSGWRTSHAPQPSQSVGAPRACPELVEGSRSSPGSPGDRSTSRGWLGLGIARCPSSPITTLPIPNPFISKQKQNDTDFAQYFPPNAHNTGRALVLTLHSSEAGSRPVKRFWACQPNSHRNDS